MDKAQQQRIGEKTEVRKMEDSWSHIILKGLEKTFNLELKEK